jgi:hypothetical protein
MWWFRHRCHHPLSCPACADIRLARYKRSVAELKDTLLIDDRTQARRNARGQHRLGVPGRRLVPPWTLLALAVPLWGTSLVTIPVGFLLWVAAFGVGMLGVAIYDATDRRG